MVKVAVYTCAIGNYDWIHRPRVKPPGVDFLRFSDRTPLISRGWAHRNIVEGSAARTPRLLSRLPKICPHAALPGYDIAVWVDSHVDILGDVTPLVDTFLETGADVAMFPHPSGRSVGEEIDFAIKAGRIPAELYEAAEHQRERYVAAGVLDRKIMECTIILYRLSDGPLKAACENWWYELITYTERDQISQPFAMQDPRLRIHCWDWHFKDPNPYFRRLPHRPAPLIERLKVGAHFLADSRLDYRFVRYAVRGAKVVKRAGTFSRLR